MLYLGARSEGNRHESELYHAFLASYCLVKLLEETDDEVATLVYIVENQSTIGTRNHRRNEQACKQKGNLISFSSTSRK